MPSIVNDIFYLLGFLLRGLGFLVIGFGLIQFTKDAYHKANWQTQIALMLGFFGLLIALTKFSSAGSAGAFALGAGVAFFMANTPKEKGANKDKKK